MKITDNTERHQKEEVAVQVGYKKTTPSLKKAKMGSVPLLCLYGEQLFNLPAFLAAGKVGSYSSDVDGNMVKVRKLTWEEHTQRRLFTENLLQDRAASFQQWLLRTINNIEDIQLELLPEAPTGCLQYS